MVGGTRVVEEAVDGLGAFIGRGVGGESFDLSKAGWHADGVEGDATQEDEVFGQRVDRGGQRPVIRPDGAFLDPLFDGRDVARAETMALGRHDFVGVLRLDARQEGALGRIAGHDRGAVGLAALERTGARIEVELTLGLAALVAFDTAGFEDGKDLRVEIHAARLHGLHLALVGDDLLGDEMIDGIVRREARGESGDGCLWRLGEPLLGGLATFQPVIAFEGAGGGPRGSVDLA